MLYNFLSLLSIGFALQIRSKTLNDLDVNYTISGLSSGAFFAVQYAIAYSSEVTGVGVIAGGPYYCAKGSETTALDACMTIPEYIDLQTLYSDTEKFANQGDIDPLDNVKTMNVYAYSGTRDTVVNTGVVEKAVTYFQHYVNSKDQVVFVNDIPSEHGMVTNDYGNSCAKYGEPYILNCNYDLVGEMLPVLLPDVTFNPPLPLDEVPYTQNLVALNQKDYTPTGETPASISLENTAYAYVATNCTIMPLSDNCRLHVAFHGCEQDLSTIYQGKKYNDTYVEYSGYNKHAETNNMVILYPQASSLTIDNPNGCWDWWAYLGKSDDPNYVWQNGVQMLTVHNMVAAIYGQS